MGIYRVSEVAAKMLNESLSVKNIPKGRCSAVVEGRKGIPAVAFPRVSSVQFFFFFNERQMNKKFWNEVPTA